MMLLVRIVNSFQPITIFTKYSIFYVCLAFECASDKYYSLNVNSNSNRQQYEKRYFINVIYDPFENYKEVTWQNKYSILTKFSEVFCDFLFLKVGFQALHLPLHKNWRFPLRISSVNMTKSAGNCGFGHIYWRNS